MRISDWSSDVCSSDLDSRVVLLWGRPTPEEQTRLTQGALDFFRYTTKLVHARMEKLEDDYPSQLLRQRSEERRVGNECVRTCKFRGERYHTKKKRHNIYGDV